jgi:hypothetical protein
MTFKTVKLISVVTLAWLISAWVAIPANAAAPTPQATPQSGPAVAIKAAKDAKAATEQTADKVKAEDASMEDTDSGDESYDPPADDEE